ncbi:MAG TPA: amidohydrolase family protein [Dehalococcoidia bacterium]|nr:amidohydrolase family protein [Dehalococcoidia bacterium]
MKPPYVVDADGHVFEVDAQVRALMPAPWNTGSRLQIPFDGGFNRDYFGTIGKQPRPTEPKHHLADMDVEGIDMAILYPTTGLFIGEVRDPDWEEVYCRAYNDWLANFCATDPNRFRGVAMVPLQEPKRGIQELTRATSKLGMVAAMVPSYFRYGPPNVGDPMLHDFYAEAEKLGVPVAVHATGGFTADTDRFRHFMQIHTCSHVLEQMIAVTAIVMGGVLEKFPRLKVGFMEAGCGWVPFWLEHMDEEFEVRHKEAPWLKRLPSQYILNSQCYFGVEPEEKLIPLAADVVGADRFFYASDYPHWDSEWPNTVKTLANRKDITDELRQKIMCDNALNFYGIKAPVSA